MLLDKIAANIFKLSRVEGLLVKDVAGGKVRQITLRSGHKLLSQNPAKSTVFGQAARDGHKIVWKMSPGGKYLSGWVNGRWYPASKMGAAAKAATKK